MDQGLFEWVQALGRSPEAIRAVCALTAYWGVAAIGAAILWGLSLTTLELVLIRQDIRERAWLTVFREQSRAGGLA